MKEIIAKAESTFLGVEDHGIFTVSIMFTFGGSGQGTPGHSLDTYDPQLKRRVGTAAGCDYIMRVISAFGVDSWEKIKGRTILVLKKDEWGGMIEGLKPLPTEPGHEFIFADWMEQAKK